MDYCALFTDEGLKHIGQLHNLYIFCADFCRNFTDEGLKYLSEVISHKSENISIFQGCPNLMKLSQNNNTKITDIGIKYLANNCPSMREIHVIWSSGITDIGVKAIAEGCKDIQQLGFTSAQSK
jgi:hypothetical protein